MMKPLFRNADLGFSSLFEVYEHAFHVLAHRIQFAGLHCVPIAVTILLQNILEHISLIRQIHDPGNLDNLQLSGIGRKAHTRPDVSRIFHDYVTC